MLRTSASYPRASTVSKVTCPGGSSLSTFLWPAVKQLEGHEKSFDSVAAARVTDATEGLGLCTGNQVRWVLT